MKLKDQIEKLKAAHKAEIAKAKAAWEAKIAAQDAKDKKYAKELVARIPESVAHALKAKRHSVEVFTSMDIPDKLSDLKAGVAYYVVELLRAEGLEGKLWVDTVRINSIMLTI